MKKILGCFLCLMLLAFSWAANVNSTTISTSAYGNMNGSDYGYIFSITDEDSDGDPTTFLAELLNDSDDALIDLLAFNMNAALNTDFMIENVNPDWSFSSAAGPIQFDYVGERDAPGDRIDPTDSLTFVFNFDDTYFASISDPFVLWTGTLPSAGVGIGGGNDSGQVAVSFQGIGGGDFRDDSDLLASNWEHVPVPEPATMLLLGTGLIGLARVGRKKFNK